MTPFSFRYQPVLGTELHILAGCDSAVSAERAQQRVLEEIFRLEAQLSTYRADTPLSQWMRGYPGDLPGEVVTVLALAEEWFVVSSGAFHPCLGGVRRRWRKAEQDGLPPSAAECGELAAQVAKLPFTVSTSGGVRRVHRRGDCADLDLDALAKGWIVDRAADAGLESDVEWMLVNVGGDLRLVGSGSARVAVEHPESRIDNARPLAVVTMSPGGLASSGPARRGFRVGGQWFGHVLDPATGWPVLGSSGVTVIADDTLTADVLTTVVGVAGLDHPTAAALLADTGSAALVSDRAGAVRLSDRWRDHVDVESVSD